MSTTGLRAAEERELRFAFGENWRKFLSVLDDGRIAEAERSLCEMLEVQDLSGRSFLDIGSGSGLFSLAAVRLGAKRVHSFDYDPRSVACTEELRRRYRPDAGHWTVERGSVLDVDYLSGLGQWDIVYSWGVLHHTGGMWSALDNAARLVRSGGKLFISIYNDQGVVSRFWLRVKRLFNRGGLGRWIVLSVFVPYFVLRGFCADVLQGRDPSRRYAEYRRRRGMSIVHDWIDWLGGYPFEVAKPERIFDFHRTRGFSLERLKTCGDLGCNEYVFTKR